LMKQIKFKKTEMELNEAYRRVMQWFFSYPTREVNLNDLTKLIRISKSTANKVVLRLGREGFLEVKELGKVWRISCNQQHSYNTTRKIAYNLELIFESGIIDAILHWPSEIQNPRSIILFGSYRKGDDTETSDIDVAVETLGNEEIKIIELGIINKLGYRRRVKVNILKFTRNKIDMNLFTNIVNGICLYGLLEARP